MTRRVVRERIDPRLTASLFANYRTATDALLELVDNAVDSRLPERPLTVEIAVHPGTVTITAVGGTGMSPAQLEREYLRWGASPKRAGERIGRYGQGGKAAIGHLGNRFVVIASPAGDHRAWAFEDPQYRDRSRLRRYELHERTKPVDPELGYVRIEIGEVDKRLDPRRLPARLGDVYRPLLERGELVVRVNRGPVVPEPWPLAERHEFSVRAGGRLIRGWYGLLADPPPAAIAPGVRIYHLGRLIGEPAWFGHPGPATHQALNRLVGEVELPHVPVTMNKADVDRDSPEWLAVEARLHRLLAPLVGRLTRAPETQASPGALRTAEQVRRILARALRLLESGQLFESEVGSGPGSGGGQLTLEQASPPEGEPAEPEATGEPEGTTPATPPGEEAEADGAQAEPQAPKVRSGGSGPGSRSGIGEVVIRALDPRLRSAMVVEDGIRRVVINSRYPLYEVRDGDLWYQLETALREVCVTIPEATVPEFERKVNELMLVSLALTERRRRSKRGRGQGPGGARPAKGTWAGG